MTRILLLQALTPLLRLWSIFVLVLISSFVSPAAFGETWAVQKIADDVVGAKWCGGAGRIIWAGGSTGIHLYDRETKADNLITQSWRDTDPFCSADGRYVFFVDGDSQKWRAYDTISAKTNTVDCFTKDVSLSPDLKVAVAHADMGSCRAVKLPSGKELTFQGLPNSRLPTYHPPRVWVWFPGNRRVVLGYIGAGDNATLVKGPKGELFPGGRSLIAIYDLAEKKVTPIDGLPRQAYNRIRILDNGHTLLFGGVESPGAERAVYSVDMRSKPLRAKKYMHIPGSFDAHTRTGLLYGETPERDRFGGHLWLIARQGAGLKTTISDQLWESFSFSDDGDEILTEKPDIELRPEREDLNVARSVYVLTKPKSK